MERSRKMPFHKTLIAWVLALAVAATSLAGVHAAYALDTGDAAGRTGSIVVHKYKTTTPSTVPGTGAAGQTPQGELVKGTEFTVYALDISKVETGVGVGGDVYAGKPLTKAPASADVDAVVAAYGDASALGGTGSMTRATGDSGTATFSNLSFGYYLLVESKPVDGMTAAVPSVITLPYASEAQDGTVTYLTEVHVYPKNVTTDLVSKRETSGKEYVEVGDELTYRITFNVPAADRVYTSDSSYMKATVTDTLPANAAGEPVVDYTAGSAKVSAVLADGTTVDLGTLASNKLASSEPSTATSGKLAWDFSSTPAFAKAVNQVNEDNPTNPVANVVIDVGMTANAKATSPSESDAGQAPAVNNRVTVSLSDATGTELIAGDKGNAESGDLYAAGFGFYKTAATSGSSSQPVYLDGAEFAISALDPGATYSTEQGNLKGIIVKMGAADASKSNWLTATSAGDKGFVSFGSLTGYKEGGEQEHLKYWDGTKLVEYTAMSTAAQTALSAGESQEVDLWLIETKAPDGYQKLSKAVKVTVSVSKASATDDLEFKVTKVDGQNVGAGGFTVENTKYGQGGFALPNTGGTGALLIVLAGLATIGIAIAVGRRGKDEEPANDAS